MTDGFQTGESACRNPTDAVRQVNGREDMLGFIRTDVDALRKIRGNRCEPFRNLKNMVPDNKLFCFLRRQNIIKLLHKIRDSFHARSGENLLFRPVDLDFRTEKEIFHDFPLGKICGNVNVSQA